MTKLTNDMGEDGWEFYRADSYIMTSTPGCLAAIFGFSPKAEEYSVACFRRIKNQAQEIDNIEDCIDDSEQTFFNKGIYKK